MRPTSPFDTLKLSEIRIPVIIIFAVSSLDLAIHFKQIRFDGWLITVWAGLFAYFCYQEWMNYREDSTPPPHQET